MLRVLFCKSQHFNPRSYKRSDILYLDSLSRCILFQSTLLQEERLSYLAPGCADTNFNPRSYKRSDRRPDTVFVDIDHFNPRSYKRSDSRCARSVWLYIRFQSTLLQEERPCCGMICCGNCYFNPRSYKRSDKLYCHVRRTTVNISIHAPTRGATAKMHNNPYTYL